jgi:AP endonuclease-1
MARKGEDRSDSSLSPPPEEPVAAADTTTSTGATANGRKRKADSTVNTTKRTKTASTADVKREETVEGQIKGKAVAGVKKPVKKATTTRKKTQEDAAPLEERTADSKLRVGAHVSVAGG